jgi:peptidylprolyl isomerase
MQHLQALRRVAPAETPEGDLGEPIVAIRVAADVPENERTRLEILRSDRPAFAAWVESRRNRPEAFFHYRPDHADVCALAVPVRPVAAAQ